SPASMVRAHDWELNHRSRSAGGTVWFSPDLHVTYRARATLSALARQYFEYGRWRREVADRYPDTISVRDLAPPVTVVAVAAGTALGLAGLVTRRPGLAALGLSAPAVYAAATAVATARASRSLPWRVTRRLPAVFATMHGAWGAGFLLGAR
ncbi:MAG: glycosyltransferase family 2 protein, partial [bacterium]